MVRAKTRGWEKISTCYMERILSKEEQVDLYQKESKEKIIEMLIEANKNIRWMMSGQNTEQPNITPYSKGKLSVNTSGTGIEQEQLTDEEKQSMNRMYKSLDPLFGGLEEQGSQTVDFMQMRDLTDEEWLKLPKEEILQLYKNCYKMLMNYIGLSGEKTEDVKTVTSTDYEQPKRVSAKKWLKQRYAEESLIIENLDFLSEMIEEFASQHSIGYPMTDDEISDIKTI